MRLGGGERRAVARSMGGWERSSGGGVKGGWGGEGRGGGVFTFSSTPTAGLDYSAAIVLTFCPLLHSLQRYIPKRMVF